MYWNTTSQAYMILGEYFLREQETLFLLPQVEVK